MRFGVNFQRLSKLAILFNLIAEIVVTDEEAGAQRQWRLAGEGVGERIRCSNTKWNVTTRLDIHEIKITLPIIEPTEGSLHQLTLTTLLVLSLLRQDPL
ncbi:hypothetical protein O9992_16895 [Vibrio lentus]|nr:hypothetical protein [Vibrio lentus]